MRPNLGCGRPLRPGNLLVRNERGLREGVGRPSIRGRRCGTRGWCLNGTLLLCFLFVAPACSPGENRGHGDGNSKPIPLRTDQQEYILTQTEGGLVARIHFEYSNVGTGSTRSEVGCNGDLHANLEQKQEGRWVQVWYPYDHGCPGMVILEPGESCRSGMSISISTERTVDNPIPFDADTVAGLYRVVLQSGGVRPYDPAEARPRADSIPTVRRASNAFRLAEPQEGPRYRRWLRGLIRGPKNGRPEMEWMSRACAP